MTTSDERPTSASRRRFLTGAVAAGAAIPLVGFGPPGCGSDGHPGSRPPKVPADLPDGLFALGVASGDPLPGAVVLWTRLAPAPLAGGGMPNVDVPVRWEVSDNDRFRGRVLRGHVKATAVFGHSVHVDVRGLR